VLELGTQGLELVTQVLVIGTLVLASGAQNLLLVHKSFFLGFQIGRFGMRAIALVTQVLITCALVHLLHEQVQVIGAQVLEL